MRNAFSLARADCAAILVDFDGTLYRHNPVRLLMIVELLLFGVGSVRVLRAFRREQERLRLLPVGVTSDPDAECSPFQLQVASAAAETGMRPEEMQALVDEWMFRRPERWLRRFVR